MSARTWKPVFLFFSFYAVAAVENQSAFALSTLSHSGSGAEIDVLSIGGNDLRAFGPSGLKSCPPEPVYTRILAVSQDIVYVQCCDLFAGGFSACAQSQEGVTHFKIAARRKVVDDAREFIYG